MTPLLTTAFSNFKKINIQKWKLKLPIENNEEKFSIILTDSIYLFHCTHSWGKEGFRKGSESLPLTTFVLRCLGSDAEATEREGAAGFGGFLFASSFLWRSMSSLCWLMPSCCLCRKKGTSKKWIIRQTLRLDIDNSSLFIFLAVKWSLHRKITCEKNVFFPQRIQTQSTINNSWLCLI